MESVWIVVTDKGDMYAFTSAENRDIWLREIYEQTKAMTKRLDDLSYDEFWGDLILDEVKIIC